MKKLGAIELSADILKKANIGLWAFELDEDSEPRMYADEAMMKLIGLEHQVSPEKTYHAWYDHIDPEHYNAVSDAVEKMKAGTHAEVQYPWHHPNGETWIVRCGGVRNFAYKKGIRIEGTHQNITKLSHYERKNLTDLLASLADNFLQVYFLDPYTGSFSSFAGNAFDGDENRDYSKINFYEDVANRSGSIVHPDDKDLINKMYSRENLISVMESGKPVDFIVRWPTGAKSQCVYMKNRLVPFKDGDGTKRIVIGVLDVTNDVVSQRELKERNTYLEHFLNGFQSAYIVDLIDNTFEILSMKHQFANVFKKDGGKNEMNEFINEHIHPEDRELMFNMSNSTYMMELLQKESEVTFTIREVFGPVEKTIRVLIIRGADPTRAAIGFMDISDEIAEEKDRNRKLEAANQAKTSFLFNMSHDIRTPMNAIIGFNNIALSHIDDKETVLNSLKKISIGSKQLLSLINDVLDMARIESGTIKCEYLPTGLKQNGIDLLDIIKQSTQKSLNIEVNFDAIKHNNVLFDKVHTDRILINVISNSIKYTPEGGTIKFSIIENTTCSLDNRYGFDFIVEDNGIGMSEEFLQHIFEEFARERTSTVSGIQGTGLGMSITKRLVDLLGGTIKIESKLGEGTKVIVHLCLNGVDDNAPIKANTIKSLDLSILKGKKVLLVEDNELNREIATSILSEYEMVIDTAEDGDVAVDKIRNSKEGQYDLILMDIQMPKMNGYEATLAIRNLTNESLASIPIIAMTANAFEEDKQNAINAGMNGHIAKPIDIQKLVRTLADIFK